MHGRAPRCKHGFSGTRSEKLMDRLLVGTVGGGIGNRELDDPEMTRQRRGGEG